MTGGGLSNWALEHKLKLIFGVLGTCTAIAAIVVPIVVTSGGGNSAKVVRNNGQINVGGVVNNYPKTDPNPSGPSVQSNSCPIQTSPQHGSTGTLTVDLFVRLYRNGACWMTSATLGQTPSTVEYLISYANTSKVVQHDVIIRVNLPPGVQLTPGTTYVANSTNPEGTRMQTDDVDQGGLAVGNYAPGANAYVAFQAITPSLGDLGCGNNNLRTVGVVHPKGMDEYYNTADIDLGRTCASPSSSGS